MKYQEIINKSADELRKDLLEIREELREFTVKLKLGQVKDMHKYGQLRKDIARIMTALTSKKAA